MSIKPTKTEISKVMAELAQRSVAKRHKGMTKRQKSQHYRDLRKGKALVDKRA
jgi:hypothetical protein